MAAPRLPGRGRRRNQHRGGHRAGAPRPDPRPQRRRARRQPHLDRRHHRPPGLRRARTRPPAVATCWSELATAVTASQPAEPVTVKSCASGSRQPVQPSRRCRSPRTSPRSSPSTSPSAATSSPRGQRRASSRARLPVRPLAAHVLGYVGALNDEPSYEARDSRPAAAVPARRRDREGRRRGAPSRRTCGGRPGVGSLEVDAEGNMVRELTSQRIAPSGRRRRASRSTPTLQAAGRAGAAGRAWSAPRAASLEARVPQRTPGGLVGGARPDATARCWPWRRTPTTTRRRSSTASATPSGPRSTTQANHYPLINRAIEGQYAAGSTFKLITAYAGLRSSG